MGVLAASLAFGYIRLRRRLRQLEIEAEAGAVEERVAAERAHERRHALINAFVAVEGAATILARDGIGPSDRSLLAEGVSSGVACMRGLLEPPDVRSERFSLSAAAGEVLREARWANRVDLDVPEILTAVGSPGETTEVLRRLAARVARAAAGRPISIRGERDGAAVVVVIEGPARARDRFRRRPGDQGLPMAALLLRKAGGELRMVRTPGGGLRLAAYLPAADPADG
jgi:hypothetical protein